MSGLARRAQAGGLAVLGIAMARPVRDALAAKTTGRWLRTNFRGTQVDLIEGAGLAVGLTLAAAAASPRGRTAAGLAVTIGASGALGGLDDAIGGSEDAKGLAGHLDALRHGRLTTGSAKLIGIPVAAFVGALVAGEPAALATSRSSAARLGRAALDAALIAGSANLLNLLDLRPGRALKAAALPAVALSAAPSSAGAAGPLGAGLLAAVVTAAPGDLAERTMAGDAGANALGAAIGAAATQCLGLPAKAGVLGLLAAATLASEKISFSAVIARTPWLRRIDEWGRVPAHPTRRGAARAAGNAP